MKNSTRHETFGDGKSNSNRSAVVPTVPTIFHQEEKLNDDDPVDIELKNIQNNVLTPAPSLRWSSESSGRIPTTAAAAKKKQMMFETKGLTSKEAENALKEYGYNEVVVTEQPIILQILSRYLGIVPLFITATAVLSAAISTDCTEDSSLEPCDCNNLNDWASFVLLIIELNLIVYADYIGSKSSGDAMQALQEASASKVGTKRDGKWIQLPMRELMPGDLVAVTIGMTIPADGVIVSKGEPLKLDYSSLTGEPIPERKGKGDFVLSGSVVLVGEAEMLVTQTGPNSSLGTTQVLIAAAKAEKESGGELAAVLSRVALALCGYGMIAAIIIAVYTGLDTSAGAGDSIKLALVILSTILPVTMPLVLTTTLAVGSQELANDDAVVQRFSAIPEMAGMDILCSDKTGTLTLGKMTVIESECETFHDDVSVAQMMELALLCSRIEHSDAIDAAITKYFDDPKSVLANYEIKKFVPFDPSTKKVTVVARSASTGEELIVVKGAPPVLMGFEGVSEDIYQKAQKALDEKSARGYKTLGVGIQISENCWKLLGFLSILDPPRHDTEHTVTKCNELGVEVKMITGDQRLIAVEVARQLKLPNTLIFERDVFGMNSHVVDQAGGFGSLCERAGGFAGVSPEHKHRVVTALQDRGHFVGMTGDGVNDAPALSIANVGIAVAGATDAARGASDIVLQREGLSTIVLAIYGSRKIFKRIQTFLIYRMCSSFTFGLLFVLIYSASGFNFPTWTLILMSLLNDFAVTSSSKDNVVVEKKPQMMNMWKITTVGAGMALVSSLQVWGFVETILNYNSFENGHFWGVRPGTGDNFSGCEVAAFTFLAMITTLQLDLIAARSPKLFWMVSREVDEDGHPIGVPPPSWQVIGAVTFSLTIATFIAVYWDDSITIGSGYGMQGIGWRNVGLTWAWALMWFVVTDFCKAATIFVWEGLEGSPQHTIENLYRNIFSLKSTPESAKNDEILELEQMRASLRDHVSESSLRTFSSRANGFSMALAALASEEASERVPPITHQDVLLAVETLQADPGLLRVISVMVHTISELHTKIDKLEQKFEAKRG